MVSTTIRRLLIGTAAGALLTTAPAFAQVADTAQRAEPEQGAIAANDAVDG